MSTSWDELLEFETKDLLEIYFNKIHNSKVNDWKVNEVASNFIQGREYFISAKNAGSAVKPVLLYYGVLALSRGLILILRPKSTENTLKSSHGLEIKNWNSTIKNKDFENLKIYIGEGSFSELLQATENINYIKANTNVVNYKSHLTIPQKGFAVTLQQMYQYLPDLNNEYKKWTGEDMPFAVLEEITSNKDETEVNIKLRISGATNELIEKLFPEQYCLEKNFTTDKHHTIIKYKNINWSPNITQKWHGPFDLGDACIVPVLQNDVGFNLLSTMFAIAYTFGMMARYFPSSWISLRRVNRGDKIYPLIHTTINFIEDKFPMVVLDFLKAPYKFENNN